MYCPKCGMENPEGTQVCVSCGMMLAEAAGQQQPQPQAAKTSRLAIWALVLALLSPCTGFLTALPAIILGIVALVKISGSGGRLKGMGLAIAGVAVPVAVIPIMAMLIAILMPAVARTKDMAHRTICGANMSGLGKAMSVYAAENNERYPTSSEWCDLLVKYGDVSEKTFICKGAEDGDCHYAMNKNVDSMAAAQGDTVLLFESDAGWNGAGGPELLTTEHHGGEGCNVLFVDGHVEFVRTDNIGSLKWNAP